MQGCSRSTALAAATRGKPRDRHLLARQSISASLLSAPLVRYSSLRPALHTDEAVEEPSMPAERFVEQLNIQIGHEFAAHQQYVACAVFYDALTMPQMAGFFYDQALEERDHAMMMIKYLIDQDGTALVPGVSAPLVDFPDVVAPVELALEQERRVTAQINELTRIAREESDFASDQFMQWFIKEQVEEVATMSALVAVVRRSKDNIEAIEEYIQREQRKDSADPMAPAVAGG
jgi:bacterioferritin B